MQISYSPFTYPFSYIVWLLLVLLTVSCNSNDKTVGQESRSQETQLPVQYGDPVRDTDGQIYQTVIIGAQTWMAENLNKTDFECDSDHEAQFVNGLERGPGVKLYALAPRYAWYKNNKDLGFGIIYNHSVVQHCLLCPPGFRIPSKGDWEILIDEVGGKSVAANALSQNGNSGFNAKFGGRIDSYGSVMAGSYGFWWCSDYIDFAKGRYPEADVFEIGSQGNVKLIKEPILTGNYVRCIKE